MRLGLALPHYDFSRADGAPLHWEGLADAARRAEALGFHSVWISDHFFLSLARYGGPEEPQGSAEPLATLAGIAAITERVRIGTLVLGAGFRHPAILAKAAATIDLVSGGRLDLGLGAGWYEHEYRAFGYRFGTAGDRFGTLEEATEVLSLLFGEQEPVTWRGERFHLEEAFCRPRPAQSPRPPLWLGGKGGPRLLRLVARRADGWNTVWAWTPDAYAERVRVLQETSEREGRDPDSVRRSVGLYTLVGTDRQDVASRYRAFQRWHPGGGLDGEPLEAWRRDKLVGTAEEVLERLASFAALGVDETIVSPAPMPFGIAEDEQLDLLAEAVLPAAEDL